MPAGILHVFWFINQIFVARAIKQFVVFADFEKVRIILFVAALFAEIFNCSENKCKNQDSYDKRPCDYINIHS